jgi:hypothetical protein
MTVRLTLEALCPDYTPTRCENSGNDVAEQEDGGVGAGGQKASARKAEPDGSYGSH